MSDSLTDASQFGLFLLSQVGHLAAQRFEELLAQDGLSPRDAGILRLVAARPEMTQQELAKTIGIHASNLVQLLDSLEDKRLLVRKPSLTDRRAFGLMITEQGQKALIAIRHRTLELESELFAAVTKGELQSLTQTLMKIAESSGLRNSVHPAYRKQGD